MKIQIISDIHGNARALKQSISQEKNVDFYIFLGDFLYHGPRNPIIEGYDPQETAKILNSLNKPMSAVRGNCDSEVDQMLINFPILESYHYLNLNDHLIYINHGHLWNLEVNQKLSQANIYMSGHTHIPVLEHKNENLIVLNPGSISLPKGDYDGSYAILENDQLSIIEVWSGQIIKSDYIKKR